MEKMEQSLMIWIEDQLKENIPVSLQLFMVRLSVCMKIGRNAREGAAAGML
jgi:hypothetical protein